MTRDIVASLPLASCCFASHGCQQLLHVALAHDNFSLRQLAFAAGPAEATVDDGGAEEPLCDEKPPARGGCPADACADPPHQNDGGRRIAGWLHKEGKDECKGGPSPPSLHEDHVENIVFSGKVAGREARILVVGLRHVVVRRGSNVGRNKGEDCAKDEDGGEDGEEKPLEGRRQERRVASEDSVWVVAAAMSMLVDGDGGYEAVLAARRCEAI